MTRLLSLLLLAFCHNGANSVLIAKHAASQHSQRALNRVLLAKYLVKQHLDKALNRSGDGIELVPEGWEVALARMSMLPMDSEIQTTSCESLLMFSLQTKDEQHAKVVKAGALQAVGRAMENFVDVDHLVSACANAACQLVVFNRESTLLLNRTTHVVELTAQHLRTHIQDCDYLQKFGVGIFAGLASGVAPELTPYVNKVGGFEIMFDAMKNCASNGPIQLAGWIGFSDHSHNPVGAEIIANHGGPLEGIKFVVDALRAHKGHFVVQPPLTLKYEIMQNINGLLESDHDKVYLDAFLKEGLPQEVITAMREESDTRSTQSIACLVMGRMIEQSTEAQQIFANLGAINLIQQSLRTFVNEDSQIFAGTDVGSMFPVVPECNKAMRLLNGSPIMGGP